MGNASEHGIPVSFEQVVDAIKSEREYQVKRWGYRRDDGSFQELEKSVSDYIVYMQDYLTEVTHKFSREPGVDSALEVLRKVVALGVACFEQHGIQPRDLSKGVTNVRDNKPA